MKSKDKCKYCNNDGYNYREKGHECPKYRTAVLRLGSIEHIGTYPVNFRNETEEILSCYNKYGIMINWKS